MEAVKVDWENPGIVLRFRKAQNFVYHLNR